MIKEIKMSSKSSDKDAVHPKAIWIVSKNMSHMGRGVGTVVRASPSMLMILVWIPQKCVILLKEM